MRSDKTDKKSINKIYEKELIVIAVAIILSVIIYAIFPKTTSTYFLIAGIIAFSITLLIKYTFSLNEDLDEERLFYNSLISIAVLLFIGINSFVFQEVSNLKIPANIIVDSYKIIGAWWVLFLIIVAFSIALRLGHKAKQTKFSWSKFFSYLSIVFIILLQLVIILNITSILPFIT